MHTHIPRVRPPDKYGTKSIATTCASIIVLHVLNNLDVEGAKHENDNDLFGVPPNIQKILIIIFYFFVKEIQTKSLSHNDLPS